MQIPIVFGPYEFTEEIVDAIPDDEYGWFMLLASNDLSSYHHMGCGTGYIKSELKKRLIHKSAPFFAAHKESNPEEFLKELLKTYKKFPPEV